MAAQSITFLGRIAFFMRGHTAEERRQRRAKGVPPLGIPRQLAGFHGEKTGGSVIA